MAQPHAIDELIADVGAFAGLDGAYVELIAGCGSTTGFDAGSYPFREGDPADSFYLIRHGRIALELFAPGRGQMIVSTFGPGEIVGWSWLFSSLPVALRRAGGGAGAGRSPSMAPACGTSARPTTRWATS